MIILWEKEVIGLKGHRVGEACLRLIAGGEQKNVEANTIHNGPLTFLSNLRSGMFGTLYACKLMKELTSDNVSSAKAFPKSGGEF